MFNKARPADYMADCCFITIPSFVSIPGYSLFSQNEDGISKKFDLSKNHVTETVVLACEKEEEVSAS